MASVTKPEQWRTGEVHVVTRNRGRFAPGSTAWKSLELWATQNGPVVKFADRDARGRFLPATNSVTSL
jgi:hypothetical protein